MIGTPAFIAETLGSEWSEVLFVQAIRKYIAEAHTETGWIAGLQDKQVERALSCCTAAP